ncbi:MAG TPA: hypothetical protein VH797_06830 [Nitrososphaeraceae archaeon]|jgi:hypothetical protein
MILPIAPELSAQVSAGNRTGNEIIMHTHSNLNVTVNGKPLIVPNGVGINSTLWNDHTLDKFGTERKTTSFGIITPAMSPLHTHDSSGMIHVESTEYKNYTLGDFLNIWGLPMEGKEISLITNGNNTKNYSNHTLKDMEKMVLKIQD